MRNAQDEYSTARAPKEHEKAVRELAAKKRRRKVKKSNKLRGRK